MFVSFIAHYLKKKNHENRTKQNKTKTGPYATVFFAEINNVVTPEKRFRASSLIYYHNQVVLESKNRVKYHRLNTLKRIRLSAQVFFFPYTG